MCERKIIALGEKNAKTFPLKLRSLQKHHYQLEVCTEKKMKPDITGELSAFVEYCFLVCKSSHDGKNAIRQPHIGVGWRSDAVRRPSSTTPIVNQTPRASNIGYSLPVRSVPILNGNVGYLFDACASRRTQFLFTEDCVAWPRGRRSAHVWSTPDM